MPQIAAFFSMLLLASVVHADQLYHCRKNSGETFWASTHCSKHQAYVERVFHVPNGLPFDQQVELGQQGLAPPSRTIDSQSSTVQNGPPPTRQQACEGFKARIAHLDTLAKQPQSAQVQDWIREERKKVRDEQFRAQC